MTKNIIITVLVTAIAVYGIIGIIESEQPKKLGQGPIPALQNKSISVSSTTVGSVNIATIVSVAPDTRLLGLSNNAGGALVDCWISATTTNFTANTGAILKASTTEWFWGDKMWTGNWYARCNASSVISYIRL